jgi:hypothetical protein
MADVLSRHVEINQGGGRPLVKVYSRKQARQLFSMFSRIDVKVAQLTRSEFYFLGRLIPTAIWQQLSGTIGWNLIVSATK